MTAQRAIIILLLVVLVALVIISWGLAGGTGDGSPDKISENPPDWLTSLDDLFPKAKPTFAKELTNATGSTCLSGSGTGKSAKVLAKKSCTVNVAKRDGTRVRKLAVVLGKGGGEPLTIIIKPKGGLPGKPKTLQIPKTMKVDGDNETTWEIDLRISEDGADLDFECQSASDVCNVSFTGLMPSSG